MKSIVIIVVSILVSSVVFGEGFKPYEWEKNRTRIQLSAEDQNLAELVLKNHIEYNYGFENGEFLMQYVQHKIILVNNTEAIQRHNRIFIPMKNTLELIDVRARAINKDGKVILFDKNNLKEIKDEESGNAYRIFAVEGIEIGSEIEYFFVRKMDYSVFGSVLLQSDVPSKSATLVLRSPRHLLFAFKGYPKSVPFKSDTTREENIYTVTLADVPALVEESFAPYEANRKRVEFKLAYNTARSKKRLNTWDDAAQTFYKTLHTLEKDDIKAIDKFVGTLGDNKTAQLPVRIRNIERKIKSTVQVNDESNDKSLGDIQSIVKYKLASNEGITKLFIGVFQKLNIPCEVVITCDREIAKFDKTFDTWNFLDDYILFFPDTKGFLAPYKFEYRYPLVPAGYTAQTSLFIEPLSVGGINSGLAALNEIPASDNTVSFDNLDIDITFEKNMDANLVKMKRSLGGYSAVFLAPYYDLITEDKKKQLVDELIKETAPDRELKTWSGNVATDATTDQFTINALYRSTHFIEHAGPRILFKAGLLIGPQVEMYGNIRRSTPIENDHNRTYFRTITINIPEGYTVKNPDDLNFNVAYTDGDNTPYIFKSTYTIAGNTLTITIDEYYKEIYAPLNRYEDFQKVVNASADFNKVTLVLEKSK